MSPADAGWWSWWPPSWESVGAGIALFIVMAVGSLWMTRWFLLRLPHDYFVGEHPPPFLHDKPRWQRWTGRVGKNLFGGFLVVLGIVLSLPGVPGQGLLTILIGVMFLDVPGKREFARRIVERPAVAGFINRLRTRHGRPPLILDRHSG